jgi:hypothetical protein
MSRVKGRGVDLGRLLLVFLVFPFGFILLVFLTPIVYVRFHALQIIVAGTRRLLIFLSSDREIRTTLIVWGILLFVIKIILQFVISFG